MSDWDLQPFGRCHGGNFEGDRRHAAKLIELIGADQARNLNKAKNLERAIRN
jgi:hypothetical protein